MKLFLCGQPSLGLFSDAQKPETPDFRHGKSVCGWPKTWTGKIVSLDEWRTLSAWDKHGPDGRHWNGITRKWEELA